MNVCIIRSRTQSPSSAIGRRTTNNKPRFRRRALYLALATISAPLGNQTAWAAEECGVAMGDPAVLVCGPANNPYTDGITYNDGNVPGELDLTVQSGVEILRTPGAGNHGVNLSTSSSITATLEQGVSIITGEQNAQGVKLTLVGASTGDLTLDSAADVSVDVTLTAAPDPNIPTVGLMAEMREPTSQGTVTVTQRENSTLSAKGFAAGGIQAQHNGTGAVYATTAGIIDIQDADYSYGVSAWALANSQADVSAIQTQTGRITISALDLGTGMYSANEGLGSAAAIADGEIKVSGPNGAGLLVNVANGASGGDATAQLGDTGKIELDGDWAYAIFTVTRSTGRAQTTVSGNIKASGTNSRGISTHTHNTASVAQASSILESGGSIEVSGLRGRGLYTEHRGEGRALSQVDAGAVISVTGEDAVGVYVDAGGAANGADLEAKVDGEVTAEGEHAVGIVATAKSGSTVISVGTGAKVLGGWQADTNRTAGNEGFGASAIAASSNALVTIDIRGTVESWSDRLFAFSSAGGTGSFELDNYSTMTGFIDLQNGSMNRFINYSGATLNLRHYADTDGDGIRDTLRIAISG